MDVVAQSPKVTQLKADIPTVFRPSDAPGGSDIETMKEALNELSAKHETVKEFLGEVKRE